MLQGVLAITAGMLVFEGYPVTVVGVGIVAHLVYMTLLRSFPMCSFTSLPFFSSIGKLSIALFFFHSLPILMPPLTFP